jgi:hypothetical protein
MVWGIAETFEHLFVRQRGPHVQHGLQQVKQKARQEATQHCGAAGHEGDPHGSRPPGLCQVKRQLVLSMKTRARVNLIFGLADFGTFFFPPPPLIDQPLLDTPHPPFLHLT